MDAQELVQGVVGVVGEYRVSDGFEFNYNHVVKWINQFPGGLADKCIILNEMINILSKYYISRQKAKKYLDSFFNSIKRSLPNGNLKQINFIRHQPPGKSQFDLLLLCDEVLLENYGFTTRNCGGSNIYVYIDDCVYSGNKFRYDISDWLKILNKGSFELITYHMVHHVQGYEYAASSITKLVSASGGRVAFWRSKDINNNRIGNQPVEIMWPRKIIITESVENYIQASEQSRISKGWSSGIYFRPDNTHLASRQHLELNNQDVIEQAFLNAGANIFSFAQNPAKSMRPMGFEVLSTIGFGALVVTYRNIANNCPLALWYGDPACGPSHPLGQWYPLFPRKV